MEIVEYTPSILYKCIISSSTASYTLFLFNSAMTFWCPSHRRRYQQRPRWCATWTENEEIINQDCGHQKSPYLLFHAPVPPRRPRDSTLTSFTLRMIWWPASVSELNCRIRQTSLYFVPSLLFSFSFFFFFVSFYSKSRLFLPLFYTSFSSHAPLWKKWPFFSSCI